MKRSIPLITHRKLLARYFKPQMKKVCIVAFLLLISVGLQLANPLVLRDFIEMITEDVSQRKLVFTAIIFISIAITNQMISVVASYLAQKIAWKAKNELRKDLLVHCLNLDISFHKEHTPGEMIERIDGDVNVMGNFFSNFLVLIFTNSIFLLGVLLVLFNEHWLIGISLSLIVVTAFFLLKWIRSISTPYWAEVREISTKFFSYIGEQVAGVDDIRSNGALGFVMNKFYMMLNKWLPSKRKAAISGAVIWSTTIFTFAICNITSFIVCYYLWGINEITVGTAYMVFLYTEFLIRPIEVLRTQIEDLQMVDVSIQRFDQLFNQTSSIIDGQEPLASGFNDFSIQFEDVTFGYNERDVALHNISFKIENGETLGIIGRTGSGKTSITRLLLRFYDPHKGEIRLGDRLLQGIPLVELRRRIGVVTQEIELFSGSIRDNLTFYDSSITNGELSQVIEELGLQHLMDSLPEGLDTMIDAGGSIFSAGEAQLLSIARVFLKKPDLIILDEAASRLDQATEKLIDQALTKLLRGRTSIIISHRISTLNRVDKIIIVQNGRIIESGYKRDLEENKNSIFRRILAVGKDMDDDIIMDDVV
ncbi:ABC transporter ATP-binding protein [Paenibacillus sp. FA6]|uniref:ABC transporter ATP-binding protein n=1 Tax=Paenibacillus sp. FA6 TaxID=3413029 RepID=UPI003F65F824